MKKKKLIVAIALALGSIILASFIVGPLIWHQPMNGQLTDRFQNLRQLHLAIQTYHLDSLTSGQDQLYPKSLQDLVVKHYLTEFELETLTNHHKIIYTAPQESGNRSDVILTAYLDKNFATIDLSGDICIKSYRNNAEQDAAANP